MSIAFRAMLFAREIHAGQRRKYTNNPYFDHLAEVAGITATAITWDPALAVAWLHDCMEDQGIGAEFLADRFGKEVADGVVWLSDMELGDRKTRKSLSRDRLSQAPAWIQTIKCADLISNTSSIVLHDPKFSVVYLEEKRLLLDVMAKADDGLREMAYQGIGGKK
jgi:(p)ppGpp synthase/HD superfamily hydrolase